MRLRSPLIAIVLLAAVPATARADGLPAVGVDAHPLALPGGRRRVHDAGRRAQARGLIEHARYGGPCASGACAGSFSIPAVAYDGSPSGLSADGRKLILISPRKRFPRRRTTFAVVDTRSAAVRRRIALRGDFSFDAISPDGRTMYLIEYSARATSPTTRCGPTTCAAGRLLREPVVDPRRARRAR